MSKKIVIDPISRIEGEGKVSIFIGTDGEVVKARFQMMEFRAFEEFVKGRMIWDMPVITSKICGICPIPHHLAAVKAVEAVLGVNELPPAALLLRKLLLAGGAIQDHALHFLYLAFPDFVFGPETPPEKRSVAGLLEKHGALVKKAVFLRKCGVQLAEMISSHSIYPVTAIPGGMSKGIDVGELDKVRAMLAKGLEIAEECAELAWKIVQSGVKNKFPTDLAPTKFMAMVDDNKGLTHYDGKVMVIDEKGNPLETFRASDYATFIEEDVERDTWGKFPYLRKYGRHQGMYRVGPLARLNAVDHLHTEKGNGWLKKFKSIGDGQAVQDIVFYHLARCIELVYEFEAAMIIMEDKNVLSTDTRIPVKRDEGEGTGIVEAPRGTLFHHYKCNKRGEVTSADLIVPTTHNNEALNLAVTASARQVVQDGEIDEGGKQQIEMTVRAYDPCLSCATHSWGDTDRLNIEILKLSGR